MQILELFDMKITILCGRLSRYLLKLPDKMIFIAISAGKGDLSDRIVRLSKHSLRPFRSG